MILKIFWNFKNVYGVLKLIIFWTTTYVPALSHHSFTDVPYSVSFGTQLKKSIYFFFIVFNIIINIALFLIYT